MELFTLQELYDALPSYQAESIKILVDKYGEQKAAELWLNSEGPVFSSQFGGEKKKCNYFERVQHQIDELVCGGKDWSKENEEFTSYGNAIGLAVATKITATIAPVVGLSPVLILPPVALIIHSICKIGIRAYCVDKNIGVINEN